MELNHGVLHIIGIIILLYSVACIVARLTPTPKDDRIVSWIGRFLHALFKKANIKDEDVEDLKSKATAIALDELKHALRDIDKQDLFNASVKKAAYKALSIKDDDNLRGMTLRLGADMEVGLEEQLDGRVMHTRIGKRIKKKLLARKLS